ncbi:hypothetical protein DYH09_11535 [bacterium CPR1]|nr:hypothetical protein [bacterium CPR1]
MLAHQVRRSSPHHSDLTRRLILALAALELPPDKRVEAMEKLCRETGDAAGGRAIQSQGRDGKIGGQSDGCPSRDVPKGQGVPSFGWNGLVVRMTDPPASRGLLKPN